MYVKREIQCGRALWQHTHITLGRIDVYFLGKQVQLEILYEVDGIRIGVVQYLPQMFQEAIQFTLLCRYRAFLILPVRCKTLLCYLVHALCANLHLDPLTSGAHYCSMQRFITIALGHAYPVAQALCAWVVEVGDDGVDLPAIFLLFFQRRLYDHTYREEVIHLIKRYMLGLHFVPDGMYGLRPAIYLKVKVIGDQVFFYGLDKLIDVSGTVALGLFQSLCYLLVDVRLRILQRQVFHLALYLVEAQPVRQRRVDVRRFR